MSESFQCHFTHPHPAHDWMPAVPDPENDRVLHLGMATVRCPGVVEIDLTNYEFHGIDMTGVPLPPSEETE